MKPTEILSAREERWNRRQLLRSQYDSTVITITICLPAAFRTDRDIGKLFFVMYDHICDFLKQKNIVIIQKEISQSADGYTAHLVVSGDAVRIKKVCVKAEEELVFGRIADIDVMDREGTQIGRKELDLPLRKCFICDMPAAYCSSRMQHSDIEIANRVNSLIQRVKSDLGLV